MKTHTSAPRSGLWQRLRHFWGEEPKPEPPKPSPPFVPGTRPELESLLISWAQELLQGTVVGRRSAARAFHPAQMVLPLAGAERPWRDLWAYATRDPAGSRALGTLLVCLRQALNDADVAVREAVAEVLGCLPSPEAAQALLPATRDPGVPVRRAALRALAQNGDRAAAPAIMQALRDPDAQVRAEAARGLGTLASQAAVPALMAALKDEEVEVRRWASRALAALGNLASAPALIEALSDRDQEVRRAAAQALGHLRAQAAVPQLIRILQGSTGMWWDGDTTELRRTAAWALGETRSAVAAPALEQALYDQSALVRAAAAEALNKVCQTESAGAPGLTPVSCRFQPS